MNEKNSTSGEIIIPLQLLPRVLTGCRFIILPLERYDYACSIDNFFIMHERMNQYHILNSKQG
jgi:hypothetical protein